MLGNFGDNFAVLFYQVLTEALRQEAFHKKKNMK